MLSERVRDILNSKNITIGQFAEMCDLPIETVRNVYYGRSEDPRLSTVLKMSEVLGTTVNCLAGRCSHTSEERTLLNFYRECGNHGQKVIMLTAKSEALLAKYEREIEDRHKIPCIIPMESVREGIMYSQCKIVDIYTRYEEAYVAIKMIDNDFVPLYCKDDIVLLSNRFPNDGEYGAFYIGGKAYIRKFMERDGEYILEAIHGIGEDIVLKRLNNLEYIGTCIEVIREE